MTSSLWRRPVIVSAVAVHAPLALPGGRTPLHIVARGRGWLRVRAGRRVVHRSFCRDGFDGVVFVDVAPLLRVQMRSLVGRAAVDVVVGVILPNAPRPVLPPALDAARLRASLHLDVPDLRPPGVRPLLPLEPVSR